MKVNRRPPAPNLARALATMAVVTGSVAIATSATAAPTPPTPPPSAVGHTQVIAQTAIEFTDGSFQWAIGRETLDPGAPAVPTADVSNTFVLVLQGAAVVAGTNGAPIARVGAGEATFIAGVDTTTLAPADGASLSLNRISLNAAAEGGTGEPFSPGPGVRDVDLLRDVLQPGETMTIADAIAAPALLLVTEGAVTIAGAPSGSADLAAGASGTFDGSLTVTNAGTTPAAVIAGVVGALVQTTPQTETAITVAPDGSTQPTEPSAPDADSDGLSDADEATAGTDPNDPDSDGDDLTDGEEVHTYGTDPLSSRTDSDHLEDGLEIERGTDPLDPDTDHDGLMDSSDDLPLQGDGDHDVDDLDFARERELGTDPANPDTDGDGEDDGVEVANGTDPLTPNSPVQPTVPDDTEPPATQPTAPPAPDPSAP